MADLPYFKFFPADYLRDTEILSLSAQGGWMRMLCSMWHPSRRGVLGLRLQALARLLGANEQTTRSIIDEIEDCQVADVQWDDDRVTISSRRMVRDWEELAAEKQASIDAGRRGAEARWGKRDRGANAPPNSPPIPNPNAKSEGRDRERERAKGSDGKPPPAGPDPLFEQLRAVHRRFSATVLDPRERKAFADNREVLASFNPEDWQAIREYYAASLPEGTPAWRPDQRLAFIGSANDVRGRAIDWKRKQGGGPSRQPAIPDDFVAWARDHYSSLTPTSAWMMAGIRAEWEQKGEDAA